MSMIGRTVDAECDRCGYRMSFDCNKLGEFSAARGVSLLCPICMAEVLKIYPTPVRPENDTQACITGADLKTGDTETQPGQ